MTDEKIAYWERWAIEKARNLWHLTRGPIVRIPLPMPMTVPQKIEDEITVNIKLATVFFRLNPKYVPVVSRVDLPEDLPPVPRDKP
jgi:hypothetical protein